MDKFFGTAPKEDKKEDKKGGEKNKEEPKKPEMQMDNTSMIIAVVLGAMFTLYLLPDMNDEITTTEFISSYVASRQVGIIIDEGGEGMGARG